MSSAWRWLWAWALFCFSTLTTWQHSCTYKWFHFDPWGETVSPCLPHLLTQAWCLCCIVLLNLVCLHNHLNISPKKSTRWRQGNTWIIILLLILLYNLFSWFFFVAIMGFYFTFLCLQYTNQNHDFMFKTNIGFRAEVCKQHASKVIFIRRETFLALIWLVSCVIFLGRSTIGFMPNHWKLM